jgi:hypothetical protein
VAIVIATATEFVVSVLGAIVVAKIAPIYPALVIRLVVARLIALLERADYTVGGVAQDVIAGFVVAIVVALYRPSECRTC